MFISNEMKPSRLFVQGCEEQEGGYSWSSERVTENDVEYISATLVEQQLAEREKQIVMMLERMKWIVDYAKRPENVDIKEQAKAGFSGAQAFEMVCYELAKALDATADLSKEKS